MKKYSEYCVSTQNCKIGLECIGGTCEKIGSGKGGDQVDTFFGCCSGFGLLDQNTETYTCANLTNSSTCMEIEDIFYSSEWK